jgi:hypothetical protein
VPRCISSPSCLALEAELLTELKPVSCLIKVLKCVFGAFYAPTHLVPCPQGITSDRILKAGSSCLLHRVVLSVAGHFTRHFVDTIGGYLSHRFLSMNTSESATALRMLPDSHEPSQTIPAKRPLPSQAEGDTDAVEMDGSVSNEVSKRQRIGYSPSNKQGHSTYVAFSAAKNYF